MTHFADLSTHTSCVDSPALLTCLNVGWLARGFEFQTGRPSSAIIERLNRFCLVSVNARRGVHACDLCNAPKLVKFSFAHSMYLLGFSEIRIFGAPGRVYAAPNLVLHYMSLHHYAPPEEFIDALMKCPDPTSIEYVGLLTQSGVEWKRLHSMQDKPIPQKLGTRL